MVVLHRFYCTANSKDPDELPQIAAYISSGFSLFPKTKKMFRERNALIACDYSIYTMNYPDITVSNFMEKSISLHKVKI